MMLTPGILVHFLTPVWKPLQIRLLSDKLLFLTTPLYVYGRTGFGIKPQKGNVSLDFEDTFLMNAIQFWETLPVFIDALWF
jgi:hypothetical protein